MAENQYIALSIFGVKGNVCFKVKRLAAFQKLFRAYEQHVKLQEGSVEYYCRGKKLAETDAPGHVGLQDDDVIFEYQVPSSLPYTPKHENHSDIAFEVDGQLFRLHKYPLLKTGSPFLEEFIEMDDGTPIPLPIPGGAPVFTLIAKYCYRDEENVATMLSPFNVVATRLAASFLQMNDFMDFIDDYLDTVVFKDAYVSSLVLASADSHGSAASPENALLQRGIAALATALDWRKVTPTHPVLTLRPLVFAALIETLAALHNVPAATTLIDVDSEGEGTDPLWEGARLLVEDNSEQGQEVHRLAEEATLCVRSGWRTLQKGGWQRAEGASDSSPRDDAVEIVSSSSPAGDGATTGKRDTHAGSHVHSAAVLYMQQWLHEHPQVLDATYFARCPTEAPQDEEYVTGTEALWPCKRPHLTQGLAVECAAAFVSLASWINVQWIHPGLLIEIAQVIAQPLHSEALQQLFRAKPSSVASPKLPQPHSHPLERQLHSETKNPEIAASALAEAFVSMATPVAGRVLLPVIGIGAAAEPETVQLLKLLPKIPVASGAKPPEPMDASTDERARRAGLLAAAAQARAGGILQSATKSNPTSSTAARGPSPPPQDDALLITRAAEIILGLCCASLKSQNSHSLVQVFEESLELRDTPQQAGDGVRVARLPLPLLNELLLHGGFSCFFRRELFLAYIADAVGFVRLKTNPQPHDGERKESGDIWRTPDSVKAVENFRRQWKNQRLGSFGIQDLLQVHACSKPLFEDAGPDTAQFGGGGLWPWLRGGEEGSEPFQGAEEEAGAAMTYEEQLFAAAKFDDNYARAKQEDNRDGSHPVVVEGLECNHAASELLVVDIASVASSPCATFGLFAAVVNRLAGSLPEHDRIRLLQNFEDEEVLPIHVIPLFLLTSLSIFTHSNPFYHAIVASLGKLRAVAFTREKELKKQICTSPHVPIEERVRVRRSNGQFEEGVIVGYSAQKQLHCVRFKNEARWYRLSEIEYEVVEDDLLQ